jgi:hypothetical protein
LHGAFIKTITGIRQLFDRALQEILDILVKDDNSIKDMYSRPDVFSKNSLQLVQELELAITN